MPAAVSLEARLKGPHLIRQQITPEMEQESSCGIAPARGQVPPLNQREDYTRGPFCA